MQLNAVWRDAPLAVEDVKEHPRLRTRTLDVKTLARAQGDRVRDLRHSQGMRTYSLSARLLWDKLEADSDFHVVIAGQSGATKHPRDPNGRRVADTLESLGAWLAEAGDSWRTPSRISPLMRLPAHARAVLADGRSAGVRRDRGLALTPNSRGWFRVDIPKNMGNIARVAERGYRLGDSLPIP